MGKDTAPPDPQPPFEPGRLQWAEPSEKQQSGKPKSPLQRFLNRFDPARYEAFLIPALACFILGNALAYGLPDHPLNQPGAWVALAVLLLGVMLYTASYRVIRSALLLLFLVLGVVCFSVLAFKPGPQNIIHPGPLNGAEIEGVVTTHRVDRQQVVLSVESLNGKPAEGRVLVYDMPAPLPPLYSRIALTGNLKEPFESTVPGTFNQRRFLADQQITVLVKDIAQVQVIEPGPVSPLGAMLRSVGETRGKISGLFVKVLPSPEAEVVGGIVLGHRAIGIDWETKQQFIHTGMIHFLAASGLHVGIVAGFVFGLASFLRLGFRLRIILAMAAVVFYALLTGLPPSVQRAATMLEFALLLKLVNRKLSSLCLLLMATAFLLVLHPNHVGSLGFQFSVLTTLGIITMVPPLQEMLGRYITRWAAGILLVPLIAQFWVTPLSLFHFNYLPLHSVPLNIAALMLIVPMTTLGFCAALLVLISEGLAQWLVYPIFPLIKTLLWMVGWGNEQVWAQWNLSSPRPWLVVALYGLLILASWVVSGLQSEQSGLLRRRVLASSLAVLLVAGTMVWQHGQEVAQSEVDWIPLSEYRSALLLKPAGSAQTVIAMPDRIGFWEGKTLSDYLRHRNIRQLDALVLWPEPEGMGTPRESGLEVVAKNRTILNTLYLAPSRVQNNHPAGLIRPDQRLRFGNLHLLNAPTDGEILRVVSAEGFCLRVILPESLPEFGAGCAVQSVERRRPDFAYRPVGLDVAGQAMTPRFKKLRMGSGGVTVFD